MSDNIFHRKELMSGKRPDREPEDADTIAMRSRLQHLQSELDRLKRAIDEHFARLNAESANRDGHKY